MALLDIRQRTGWLFGALVVSHIILISAQVTTKRGVPVLQEVTFGLFAEMQRASTSALTSAQESWQNYFALQQIRQENERLKKEVTQLSVSLQQERTPRSRRGRCRGCWISSRPRHSRPPRRTVIGSGADPEFRTITIDKGTQDGLRADMAVISPAGVVGRILMPTARAAKVQLIIDRDAAGGCGHRAVTSRRPRERHWQRRCAGLQGRAHPARVCAGQRRCKEGRSGRHVRNRRHLP